MDPDATGIENSSKGEMRDMGWKVWKSLLERRLILHLLPNYGIKSQTQQSLSSRAGRNPDQQVTSVLASDECYLGHISHNLAKGGESSTNFSLS